MTISTRTRIGCARLAYQALNVVRGPWRQKQVVVTRAGVRWSLDLREGIDLSVYLFGSFEPSVVRSYKRLVPAGATVVDVGANVGAHTLPLAQAVGVTGRVIAFEPTVWAFEKMRANLDLNPDLGARVRAEQVMLVGDVGATVPGTTYSSWPLVTGNDLHPQHRGRLMSTDGARATTLDAYIAANQIDRIDFVKLDVDGAEPMVLAGAMVSFARHTPTIVMELAPYIYEGTDGFERLVGYLGELGYTIRHLRSGRSLPLDPGVLRDRVPPGSSMNVLCVPGG